MLKDKQLDPVIDRHNVGANAKRARLATSCAHLLAWSFCR